jgi:hypothetical protein
LGQAQNRLFPLGKEPYVYSGTRLDGAIGHIFHHESSHSLGPPTKLGPVFFQATKQRRFYGESNALQEVPVAFGPGASPLR